MKKIARKLSLNPDTVRQLSVGHLGRAAGGISGGPFGCQNTVLSCVDTQQCTYAQTQCTCPPTFGCPAATAAC